MRLCARSVFFVLGLLCLLCVCSIPEVRAQSVPSCTQYQAGPADGGHGTSAGPLEPSLDAAESDAAQILQQAATNQANGACTIQGFTFQGCSGGSCSATSQSCTYSGGQFPGGRWTDSVSTQTTQGACPTNPCTAKAGQPAFVGGASAPGSVCDGQCQVETPQPALVVSGGGSSGKVYESTYSGNTCSGATAGVSVSPTPQCVAGSGENACAEQVGKNCGTFNGDEVCPASIPPGTCVSFASGGVACTAAAGSSTVPSPPGPNNGTAGQAAQPSGQVAASSGGAPTVTNYYGSSVVNNSSSGVPNTPGGQNVGNAGLGLSTSTSGGGSQPNAANGDCGAAGVNCAGDSTVPTLPTEPTIAQSTQTYTNGLAQVPIVAAVSNIAASVPAGVCPTATISVFGHDFVMDAQCTMWDQLSPLLSLCFLAMWTFIGVRIVMTA